MENREHGGFKYSVLDEPEEIKKFVSDMAVTGWNATQREKYGAEIANLDWKLEVVQVASLALEQLVNEDALRPKITSQLELHDMTLPIPPLVVRGSDMMVLDGYARVYAFRKLGVTSCLAYVGRVK